MKKIICIVLLIALACTALVACGKNIPEADYKSAEELESAIRNGADVDGKIVTFTVENYMANAPMGLGHCLEAGNQLKFCSDDKPNADEGDTITVEITSVINMLGTYIIEYEMLG